MIESKQKQKVMRVLIIGAGGFIGGFIAKESLRRGHETWVGIRASTSRRFLSDERLHFLILDYDSEDAMTASLKEALPQNERWDCIIYNLGATKCTNFADFNRINFLYLRSFINALRQSGKIPDRFLYMSSLSALGTGNEKNYTPITDNDIPNPNTRYGLSKIKAETFLETCPDIPWIIFRPTGVYGPHEQDYLMMIKSIDRHFDFGVGFRKQLLTFIYVEDLATAMFDAIISDNTVKKKYIISEPRSYTQREFRKIVSEELGRRCIIPLRLPMWIVYIASVISEKYGVARLKPSTLNRDKYKIMRQRNWNCDVSNAIRDFNFAPKYSLRDGIRATVKAYINDKQNPKENKK